MHLFCHMTVCVINIYTIGSSKVLIMYSLCTLLLSMRFLLLLDMDLCMQIQNIKSMDIAMHYIFWLTILPTLSYTNDTSVYISIPYTHPIHVTNERFLSVAMTPHLVRKHFKSFNITSPLVRTLARGLSPAYMRFGDTDGDRMRFTGSGETASEPYQIGGFNMSADAWDAINKFAFDSGWDVIYGVNSQIRTNHGEGISVWNPANFVQLLNYSSTKQWLFNMSFELGNEPDLYTAARIFEHVTPEQLATDFCTLRKILASFGLGDALIVGPDVTQTGTGFIKRFLGNSDGCLNATSWHFYYGRGEELWHVENYTNPQVFDRYLAAVRKFKAVISKSGQPFVQIWQGETASTVTPVANNTDIGESYVACFMFLDKLGVSASSGIDVVIKQAFYEFWFSYLDRNLKPTPLYWSAILFKRLVGVQVLHTNVSIVPTTSNTAHYRAYTHCTALQSGYPKGSIVIYAMNLSEEPCFINFNISKAITKIDQYLLSPMRNNLLSKNILLNNIQLKLVDDTTLPDLNPVVLPTNSSYLASKRMAFYVIPDASYQLCV